MLATLPPELATLIGRAGLVVFLLLVVSLVGLAVGLSLSEVTVWLLR